MSSWTKFNYATNKIEAQSGRNTRNNCLSPWVEHSCISSKYIVLHTSLPWFSRLMKAMSQHPYYHLLPEDFACCWCPDYNTNSWKRFFLNVTILKQQTKPDPISLDPVGVTNLYRLWPNLGNPHYIFYHEKIKLFKPMYVILSDHNNFSFPFRLRRRSLS